MNYNEILERFNQNPDSVSKAELNFLDENTKDTSSSSNESEVPVSSYEKLLSKFNQNPDLLSKDELKELDYLYNSKDTSQTPVQTASNETDDIYIDSLIKKFNQNPDSVSKNELQYMKNYYQTPTDTALNTLVDIGTLGTGDYISAGIDTLRNDNSYNENLRNRRAYRQAGYDQNPKASLWGNQRQAMGESGINAATFGFSDEATSALEALASGGNYDEIQQNRQATMDKRSERHPIASTVGTVGGALLGPGLAGKTATKVGMEGVLSAENLLGRIAEIGARVSKGAGKGAVVGGTEGAIAGAGFAEQREKADFAKLGTLTGMAGGALLGGIQNGIPNSVANLGKNIFSRSKEGAIDILLGGNKGIKADEGVLAGTGRLLTDAGGNVLQGASRAFVGLPTGKFQVKKGLLDVKRIPLHVLRKLLSLKKVKNVDEVVDVINKAEPGSVVSKEFAETIQDVIDDKAFKKALNNVDETPVTPDLDNIVPENIMNKIQDDIKQPKPDVFPTNDEVMDLIKNRKRNQVVEPVKTSSTEYSAADDILNKIRKRNQEVKRDERIEKAAEKAFPKKQRNNN